MTQEIDDQLYEVDLRQVERIRKLAHRLSKDLAIYDQYTQRIALQESAQDYLRVGLTRPPEEDADGHGLEVVHGRLESDRNKVILALKSSIWSSSNALKKDHDRAKVILARIEEQGELEEV